MRAAKAWGLTPREWRAENVDDRGLMLAFILFEATLDARRDEWREEQEERRKRGSDENDTFSKMKQRMGLIAASA